MAGYNFSALRDNDNNEGNHGHNNHNNHNSNRLSKTVSFGKRLNMSALDDADHTIVEKPVKEKRENRENPEKLKEKYKAILEDFTKGYSENKTSSAKLMEIINDKYCQISAIIASSYYNAKYDDIMPQMNAVLKLMSTKIFSMNLLTAFKDDLFNLDEHKDNIGRTISLVIRNLCDKMVDDTIGAYSEIMTNYVYPEQITALKDMGFDEELASDFVIGIPMLMTKMSEYDMRNCYTEFISIILDYTDDLIKVMDAQNQEKLFYTIFPDIDGQTLKVVGKCLATQDIDIQGEEANALYSEYKKMLYNILNNQEHDDIIKTLKYIVRSVSNRMDKTVQIVFNGADVVDNYKHLAKALNAYCKEHDGVKFILF